jgi:hypothetical protein
MEPPLLVVQTRMAFHTMIGLFIAQVRPYLRMARDFPKRQQMLIWAVNCNEKLKYAVLPIGASLAMLTGTAFTLQQLGRHRQCDILHHLMTTRWNDFR